MKIEIGKIHCEIEWLKDRPERPYYQDECQISSVTPILEIGVNEREDFKIYYLGVWKFSFMFSLTNDKYEPSWITKEKLITGNVLPFRLQKRKRIKNDIFNKSMGDKPSE